MTELSEIDGVGPSYAETLDEAGYDDAEAVAEASADELDGLISTMGGTELKAAAQAETQAGDEEELVEEVVEEELLDDDEEVNAEIEDGSGDTEDDDGEEVFEITPGFSEDQENHLIAALVNAEITSRRRNNSSRLESCRGAIAEVRAGEPYHFTLEQLSIAYTATNQLESEYRGTRGLASFVSQVRALAQYFQSARQENWPESA